MALLRPIFFALDSTKCLKLKDERMYSLRFFFISKLHHCQGCVSAIAKAKALGPLKYI